MFRSITFFPFDSLKFPRIFFVIYTKLLLRCTLAYHQKRTPIYTKKQSTVWVVTFSRQWLKRNAVFLHATPCALVGIYWRFGRTCRLHLVIPWGRRQHDPPKRWQISIILHGITCHKTNSLPFFHTSVNFNN
jgi:hypothetical protein